MKCKYCGQDAGFFSRSHRECEEKHNRGIQGMTDLMRRYFSGAISTKDFSQKLEKNRLPYFLTEDEIANSALVSLKAYADTLKRPFPSNTLPLIKEFISAIKIPYQRLNQKGEMDDLGQKLFQGYLIDYFAKGVPLSQVKISSDSVLSVIPLSQQKQEESYFSVLNRAADKFMAKGGINDNEQQLIETYASSLGINLNRLPMQYQNQSLAKIGEAAVLKDLQKGILPKNPLTVPVMLGKGEVCLWVYDNVKLYQERITREFVGGNRGLSFRIAKGITYRTGSFKGRPIEKSFMENKGTGSLVITNKHFFFHCPTCSIKVPYNKLIGMTPYTDGLEIHKDEAKQKRIVFEGFDPWFTMNALNLLNS